MFSFFRKILNIVFEHILENDKTAGLRYGEWPLDQGILAFTDSDKREPGCCY